MISNDDLLKMAEEAGFSPWKAYLLMNDSEETMNPKLQKFAALVQAATAEECAKVCEAIRKELQGQHRNHAQDGAKECLKAIRTTYLSTERGDK